MQPRIKRALDRFEEATNAYAFRGTYSPERKAEVVEEFHQAREILVATIDKALREAFRDGENDAYSRARNRPGDGDMGG